MLEFNSPDDHPHVVPANAQSERKDSSLSPCGRGWTRCEASRTGEGSVSADRDPSSGALCAPPSPTREEGKKGRREEGKKGRKGKEKRERREEGRKERRERERREEGKKERREEGKKGRREEGKKG